MTPFKASVVFIAALASAYPQSIPLQTTAPSDQSNNIRQYLTRVAGEITDQSLTGINTLNEWQDVRPQRYQEFIEMMGLLDVPLTGERPPLNVETVGTIQKNGYRIIKLYYESLPQLYVPANLYVPDNINGPAPAILYLCGHARTQKVHYQSHARRFAQLGFVCLIIETIQWGEVRGEHWGCYANGWFHWYSRGYTPGGVEVWNAIRGLDLLCQRPEVDGEKLGVTGISGGGAQTWFVAAADPRIKAAAPVCGASTLAAHILTRTIDGHCDCMVPINTYLRDFPDIGALIAPRPLLVCQADRDGLNTIESVREIVQKVKSIYDLYNMPDQITLVETPGGHSYHPLSRNRIFSFFMKHLQGKEVSYTEIDDSDFSEMVPFSEEELRVYIDGPPPDDRTKTIQDAFITLPDPPQITSISELNSFRGEVLTFLSTRTFGSFPREPEALDPRLEFRTWDGGKYGRTVYSYVSEKGWRLKADIRWQTPQDTKSPILIALRSPDEKRGASEEFVAEFAEPVTVVYLETRGVGEMGWAPELQWHVRRAAAWTGRTVASMRIYDLLRCIDFLKMLPGVDPDKIGIAARDEMTVVALYAALLNGGIHTVVIKNPPRTQNAPSSPDGRGETIELLNCLRMTDIYQIPALLFPMNMVFVGELPESYQWSIEIYQTLGRADAMTYK
ncbi:acetylxylan esterase [bacterium]|nr:acetylxylan esterase [bacterium]